MALCRRRSCCIPAAAEIADAAVWERDQQTVSERLDLPAAPAPNLPAQEVQAGPEYLLSRLVTEPPQEGGGADQIGEEHRDETVTCPIEALGLEVHRSRIRG